MIDKQQCWRREAAYFDEEDYTEEPLSPETVRRYLELEKPWLAPECAFHVLGDVRGKKVLEIGCGDGRNAIILALRGAEVWAIDVSAKAIAVAKSRAVLHGVEDRTHFICTPIEKYAEECGETFDAVFGAAILHHLLLGLGDVLASLAKLAHRQTVFVCTEPVTLYRWVRKLRLLLPIPVRGTPDERPLESHDLDIIRRQCSDLRAHYFGFLLRVFKRLFNRCYETASPRYRAVFDSIARVDNFLLQTLGLKSLASTAVLCGHLQRR